MKWFGESWGAPVCDPAEWTETPVGSSCLFCPNRIAEDAQGFLMPSFGLAEGKAAVEVGPRHAVYAVHLDCMLKQVGVL